MKELYLKKLTEEDKDSWLEYMKEYSDVDKKVEKNFYDALDWHVEKEKLISKLNIFYLMEDSNLIGRIYIHLKPELLPKDKHDGSHISYSIIPSKRRQGYGSKMLHLGLEKCREFGLKEVIVSCLEENIASAKVIENNYGILFSVKPDIVQKDKMLKTYKIDVEDSLNRYSQGV